MALTGAQLLTGLSKFIDDYEAGTTTSAGASDGTTLVDTSLGDKGDGHYVGYYVRPTGATNQYAVRRVTAFEASTGTLTVAPAFSAQTATSQTYELHRFEPERKFEVLDEARFPVFPDLFKLVYDETVTTDGRNVEYAIPSSIRVGPAMVWVEEPIAAEPQWNFLTDPRMDATDNWTASAGTLSLVTRSDADLLIPKYDTNCIKWAVSGSTEATLSQAVSAMSDDITAAKAAGREMSLGFWVYCTLADKVTVVLEDDAGENASSVHQGLGWEFLTVTVDVSHTNSATLTAKIKADNDSNAVTLFVNRGWLMFGPRIPAWYNEDAPMSVRRDDTTQRIMLPYLPPRGRQLRLVGKDVLSALGTTVATQVTNTMEVDVASAGLLYAKAAELLFQGEGLNIEDVPRANANMASVMRKGDELRPSFKVEVEQRIRTPYSG